jgi:hypothetical protein
VRVCAWLEGRQRLSLGPFMRPLAVASRPASPSDPPAAEPYKSERKKRRGSGAREQHVGEKKGERSGERERVPPSFPPIVCVCVCACARARVSSVY